MGILFLDFQSHVNDDNFEICRYLNSTVGRQNIITLQIYNKVFNYNFYELLCYEANINFNIVN